MHPLEHLAAHDEEAAVDPDSGGVHGPHVADGTVGIRLDDVRVEVRSDEREHDQLPGSLERPDEVRQVDVGQAVAVGRHEHLVVAEVGLNELQALTDRRPHPRVGERDPPLAAVAVQDLDLGVCSVSVEDEIVEQRLVVVQEVLLDHVALVAQAENELVVPPGGVVAHDVPEDRPVADGDHRLRDALRLLAHAHAEAATEDHHLHVSRAPIVLAFIRDPFLPTQ
jgi:hypothetical protein